MTVHIELMFSSLLASAFVYGSAHFPVNEGGCFEENIHYIGLALPKAGGNNNYGPTGSAEGCQSLCQRTDGCRWFNWEGKVDKCWLKTGKGNQTRLKSGGVTGSRFCPTGSAYEICGIEKKYEGKRKRISGGNETRPNQYPWMVRIHIGPENKGCGGSLITDRHVLTAKHCITAGPKYVKVSVHNQDDPRDYEIVQIKNSRVHIINSTDDSMAIIILKRPVDLTDETIGTVCLPASADEDYRGEIATAMGWGMTHKGSPQSSVLKHVNLPVSQKTEKYWLFTDVPLINDVPQDPCSGDSGGPLVHKDMKTGRWTIIGTLTGAGYNCRYGITFGKGQWNKVTDHLTWIRSVIGEQM